MQFRESQGHESARFLSYFPRFICLHGGISTGFHHVSSRPQQLHKLYKISLSRQTGGRSHLLVREVPAEGNSLVEGDVFVLDKGTEIWQLNTKNSLGQEKFKAAEFVQSLVNDREGQGDVKVFGKSTAHMISTPLTPLILCSDEGGRGSGIFFAEFGVDSIPHQATQLPGTPPALFRVSDSSGSVVFEPVKPVVFSSLASSDTFLLDHSGCSINPAIYMWIGSTASLSERRLVVQYAQTYAHQKQSQAKDFNTSISLVKMNEGHESDAFMHAFNG